MPNVTPLVADPRSLKLHEVTALFPAFPDEKIAALGRNIVEEGLHHPIWVLRGADRVLRIIDGRNRWVAALNAGYQFKPADFREYQGHEDDLLEFVWGLNGDEYRRHLTDDQRAALARDLLPRVQARRAEKKRRLCSEAGKAGGRGHAKPGDGKGLCENEETLSGPEDSVAEVAEMVGVSAGKVRDAGRIRDASPEAFDRVRRGETTIRQAKRDLGLAPGRHKVSVNGRPLIDVSIPDPEKVTKLADVAEDMAERAAMKDADSDGAWVESLELYRLLPEGKRRDDFAREAVLARRFWEGGRRDLAKSLSSLVPGNRKPGPYFWRFVDAMKQPSPEYWILCAEADGGCGGGGQQGFASEKYECPECHGRGFRIG